MNFFINKAVQKMLNGWMTEAQRSTFHRLGFKAKMFADNARGDIAAFKADFFLAAARRHADAGEGGGRERCAELYEKALDHAAERGPVHREFADALDAGAAWSSAFS